MIEAAETTLRDGRTHWRRAAAARVVDGEAYLSAFPERFLDDFRPEAPPRRELARRITTTLATALAFAALVAVWRHTPLAEFVTLPYLVCEAHALSDRPWLPVYVLCTFIFGGFLMMPVTSLIVLAALGYALQRRFGVDEERQ